MVLELWNLSVVTFNGFGLVMKSISAVVVWEQH
jgi:hypothetical protein